MKILITGLALLTTVIAFGQNSTQAKAKPEIPAEVLTDDTTYWTITTLSNVNYVNTTPGAYYNTSKSGGGMIVKFKFLKDGRYEFMLYVQANTYGIENESWTHVEGRVEFTKNEKGHSIFRTIPVKGKYRFSKNGKVTERPATMDELNKSQKTTYLWERWQDPNDKKNDYMLVVDLTKNPNVDLDDPKTLTPDMVSRFHIPKK